MILIPFGFRECGPAKLAAEAVEFRSRLLKTAELLALKAWSYVIVDPELTKGLLKNLPPEAKIHGRKVHVSDIVQRAISLSTIAWV